MQTYKLTANYQRLSLLSLIGLVCAVSFSTLQAQQLEPVTGLIMVDGWQAVQENCTECHSTQLIIQNSGNRDVWKSRLIWMQQTQGLVELSAATEKTILDYLASNYGPKTVSRRASLAEQFLPTNPYEQLN